MKSCASLQIHFSGKLFFPWRQMIDRLIDEWLLSIMSNWRLETNNTNWMNLFTSKRSRHVAEFAVNCLRTLFSTTFLSLPLPHTHTVARQAGHSDWKRYQCSTHLTWIVSQSQGSLLPCWIIFGSQSWLREEPPHPHPEAFVLARGSRGRSGDGAGKGGIKELKTTLCIELSGEVSQRVCEEQTCVLTRWTDGITGLNEEGCRWQRKEMKRVSVMLSSTTCLPDNPPGSSVIDYFCAFIL